MINFDGIYALIGKDDDHFPSKAFIMYLAASTVFLSFYSYLLQRRA